MIPKKVKIPVLLIIPISLYLAGFLALSVWNMISAVPGPDLLGTGPAPSYYTTPVDTVLRGPAPSFTLLNLDGQPQALNHYSGQVVLLNFWATWCIPCQLETPLLEETAIRFRTQGVVIIGIDQAEDAATVNAYLKRFNVTFPILLDTDLLVTQDYNVVGLPTSFFIDSKGIVRVKNIGMLTRDVLQQYLSDLLPDARGSTYEIF